MAASTSFHPIALRSEKSGSTTGCHSAVVQKAAGSVSKQLRANALAPAACYSGSRQNSPTVPSASADQRIYGLQHLATSYPSHPQNKSIKLLTAKQYFELQQQDLALNTPESVLFPWLHGADQRGTQQAHYFGFASRPCKTPRFRGLTTVSADSEKSYYNPHSRVNSLGGKSFDSTASFSSFSTSSSSSSSDSDLSCYDSEVSSPASMASRGGPEPRPCLLLSSFTPEDLLLPSYPARFQEIAVPPQVNLRNFRLQSSKLASVSDIVIYSADGLASPELLAVAERFLSAQHEARKGRLPETDKAEELVDYQVFVVVDPFEVFERFYPDLVAVTSNGYAKNKVDFFEREREEMRILTQASPIADGVWLGNTQDVPLPKDGSPKNDFSDLGALAAALEASSSSPVISTPARRNRLVSSDSSSSLDREEMDDGNPHGFAICIEAHDQAFMAGPEALKAYEHLLDRTTAGLKTPEDHVDPAAIVHLECISTGQACIQPGHLEHFVDNLLHLIMWIRRQVKPSAAPATAPSSPFPSIPLRGRKAKAAAAAQAAQATRLPRNVLIHTTDGYTDTSVLALAYIMYDRSCTLPQAYLHLQLERSRSFFVYPADVPLLCRLETKIMAIAAEERRTGADSPESEPEAPPSPTGGLFRGRLSRSSSPAVPSIPRTFSLQQATHTEKMISAPFFYNEKFDGHFPSRILPFLYLGNLNHATNALMLKELGITHVVSIGETALIPPRSPSELPSPSGVPMHLKARIPTNSLWLEASLGNIEVLDLRGIADDGIDPIRDYIQMSNDFIEDARQKGGKVLVHCRVGVSRSASLVIAYVMRHCEMDLQSAYLLVRSRRLNILIQPTILFMWTLQWFEAQLNQEREAQGKKALGTTLAWGYLCREMCELNARYLNC